MSHSRRLVWLDCDPGHDDAIAILLAVHCPNIHLLGVSTCHGNSHPTNTHANAVRLLHAYNAPVDVHAHRGAIKPLIHPARTDPEIHGEDGLGGVEGLPTLNDPAVKERWNLDGKRPAVDGMAKAVKNSFLNGSQVCIATTGPLTNLAMFLTFHPELYDAIEEIVFMGGGVGIGNRSAVAEYNILCDRKLLLLKCNLRLTRVIIAEAAQIVLNAPIKKTMIPLNVTHTCIFTSAINQRLLNGPKGQAEEPSTKTTETEAEQGATDPLFSTSNASKAITPLRHTLSTLILFFASTYKSTFGFNHGPPLHDALTIAYLCQPSLFKSTRYRVDVELAGKFTTGETVVDLWNYCGLEGEEAEDWAEGKNCLVAESVDVPGFFELFLACVDKCDKVSPLNQATIESKGSVYGINGVVNS